MFTHPFIVRRTALPTILMMVFSLVMMSGGCIGTPKPPPPTDFPRLFAPPPVVLRPIDGLRVDPTIPVPEKGFFFTDSAYAEIVRQYQELRQSDETLRAEIEEYERWRESRKPAK